MIEPRTASEKHATFYTPLADIESAVARWRGGYGAGLVNHRLRVRLPVTALQGLKWVPLICRVYNGSVVYSLVALNRIKYRQ